MKIIITLLICIDGPKFIIVLYVIAWNEINFDYYERSCNFIEFKSHPLNKVQMNKSN